MVHSLRLASLSEDFQRKVSLTDPQVLRAQILSEISQMEFAFPTGSCTGGDLVINDDGSFSGEFFVYDLETVEKVEHHVGSQFAVIPPESK